MSAPSSDAKSAPAAALGVNKRPRVFLDISIGGKPEGRVVIELFDDIAPKTAKNFYQLIMGTEKSRFTKQMMAYKGSRFHRVIKNFIAQGGDFARGDGTGGESIYGPEFADENLKTKHDTKGLLSMANCGPNTNGSQFFITLAPTPHLDGKHCVFGKVCDNFEVIRKIEAVPVNRSNDRPTKECVITDCGDLATQREKEEAEAKEAVEAAKTPQELQQEARKKQITDQAECRKNISSSVQDAVVQLTEGTIKRPGAALVLEPPPPKVRKSSQFDFGLLDGDDDEEEDDEDDESDKK